jgi:hypothetical protein
MGTARQHICRRGVPKTGAVWAATDIRASDSKGGRSQPDGAVIEMTDPARAGPAGQVAVEARRKAGLPQLHPQTARPRTDGRTDRHRQHLAMAWPSETGAATAGVCSTGSWSTTPTAKVPRDQAEPIDAQVDHPHVKLITAHPRRHRHGDGRVSPFRTARASRKARPILLGPSDPNLWASRMNRHELLHKIGNRRRHTTGADGTRPAPTAPPVTSGSDRPNSEHRGRIEAAIVTAGDCRCQVLRSVHDHVGAERP